MIIVVEGPSAAGKTTWIAAHCQSATVIGEARAGPVPDRAADPDGAAAHWAAVSAGRWHAAVLAEQRSGTAVCDTDPLKLHYAWSLWQTGHASRCRCQAELIATPGCSPSITWAWPTSSSSRSPIRLPWLPAARPT